MLVNVETFQKWRGEVGPTCKAAPVMKAANPARLPTRDPQHERPEIDRGPCVRQKGDLDEDVVEP